ncbi:MAG TPA: folylpolyglutamate synthase/dihydrofolate synthase [Kandleria vitulina]|nr:folylpolyglutamate synthase/dihydrofolate synthase [Kandleria vitulina]
MDGHAILFLGERMEIQLLSKKNEEHVRKILKQYDMVNHFYIPGYVMLLCFEDNQLYGFIELYQLEKITALYSLPGEKQDETFALLIEGASRIGFRHLTMSTTAQGASYFKQFGFHVIQEQPVVISKTLPCPYHFKDYDEISEFMSKQKSRVYSLDHFKDFMHEHFNIQYVLKCVHIGGTNGKGSTTNYVKEIMKTAGYEVGTFTTPALVNRLDVIRVDDQAIDEKVYVKLCNRFLKEAVDAELSLYEMEVFISVIYFIYKKVDLALFEVGLGGLLDATNIIGPLLCVNTNIGLDHTDYLGSTYEEIARNKAGIVKDGVPYVTSETREECLDVFDEVTKAHHAPLYVIAHPEHVESSSKQVFNYHGYHVCLNTPATYQSINAALAINVVELIRAHFPFDHEDVETGLYNAKWPGRFEIIHHDPLIIIDGAHNREGMDAFVKAAEPYRNAHIIFTALRDKDTTHMLERLLTLSDDITVTQFEHHRRALAKDLAKDYPVKIEEDWKKAVDEAMDYPVVLITGSLYFLSQVRKYILDEPDK